LRAVEEKVHKLKDAGEMYGRFTEVVFDNEQVDKSNEFLLLIEDMYLTHMLVGLRTLDDTDLRSHSLYNLIEEVLDHREYLPRKRFIDRWGRRLARKGREVYENDWGTGDYPARSRVQNDLSRLKRACKQIRPIVNQHIAHTDRRRRKRRLNLGRMSEAIGTMYELWQRYSRLVRGYAPTHPSKRWEEILDKPIRGRQAASRGPEPGRV
jgi:hypothetical protein